MNKIILSIIVIFLLPISVYGWDWTVGYHIKNSYGILEFVEVSVPEKFPEGLWELPNLEGNLRCNLVRIDIEDKSSSYVSLGCRSKESELEFGIMSNRENIKLHSEIICDVHNRKFNQLNVVYHTRTNIKDKHSRTQIQLKCKL